LYRPPRLPAGAGGISGIPYPGARSMGHTLVPGAQPATRISRSPVAGSDAAKHPQAVSPGMQGERMALKPYWL